MSDLRLIAAGLAAAAATTACQPAKSPPAAKAEAAPAAAAAATAAATPNADLAKVWVIQLYGKYADEDFSPFNPPEKYFDREFLAALAEDERLTPEGEIGAIDADPICSCQDPGGMTAEVLKAEMTGPNTARVEVRLKWPLPENPIPDQVADYTRTNVLHLVMTPDGWRIHDAGEGESSFLKYVTEENARRRAGRASS